MSPWLRQPSRQATGRFGAAAGRSAGGLSLGSPARRHAAVERSEAGRGDADDDRQRSQRLAAVKQFDLDGQIG